jgi:hypothetical protein
MGTQKLIGSYYDSEEGFVLKISSRNNKIHLDCFHDGEFVYNATMLDQIDDRTFTFKIGNGPEYIYLKSDEQKLELWLLSELPFDPNRYESHHQFEYID